MKDFKPERAELIAWVWRQKCTLPYVPAPAVATYMYVEGSKSNGSSVIPYTQSIIWSPSADVGISFILDIWLKGLLKQCASRVLDA